MTDFSDHLSEFTVDSDNSLKESLKDPLTIGGRIFSSRLLIGTGKFASLELMRSSLIASRSEVVTMALRRINLEDPQDQFLESIKNLSVLFLPNTSGARSAPEAVRLAEIARRATGNEWVKLEVTPDPKYLLPDPVATLEAAKTLVNNGFKVMPYIHADPVLAKLLEEVGCVCVMPLGSPIGSNQGVKTRFLIEVIIEQAKIPVIVDAGLGTPSHAAEAMEIGADGVLVNTAIATSKDPVLAAQAFQYAVQAGRMGYLSRLLPSRSQAQASSPLTGFFNV